MLPILIRSHNSEVAKAGDNVRPAGEDLTEGALVLQAGRCLLPPDLGLIAALGIVEVSVYRSLRVATLSTGDELQRLGRPLLPGMITTRFT